MIPASYLFRAIYRDRFEEAEPAVPAPRLNPRPLEFSLVTTAILTLAQGAGHLLLSPGPTLGHDRRR